ncbi:MAG TPA: AAA family ATPase [Chthoniobacterales bacterium]
MSLPFWASELAALYESNAATQFILHGNVNDRFLIEAEKEQQLGSLTEYFLRTLMQRFDVVLSYDIGNGIRVEKGGDVFARWPTFKESPELPKTPRPAIEFLTRYFRYNANLARLGKPRLQIGCLVKAAQLLAPAVPGMVNFDLNSLALLIREWADDPLLTDFSLATCLIAENLNDLNPLLTGNPRAAKIKVPLPDSVEIERTLRFLEPQHPKALAVFAENLTLLADQLNGATQNAIDNLLKLKEYRDEALQPADLVKLKKQIVEDECQGLIEFIQSRKSLDDLQGQDGLKTWLRQDLALWEKGDTQALPMGYLICGPVGTGKTYLVECLSGEAGVPVVKLKNFRDKWVGTTEGNLEKIFRLLQALTRCYVFIDEADQTLGKRDAGSNDSGLSGRIYSMMAQEMSRPENRGRIIWVLASSRPDLIEVDLKRPGRVDVKIPIFPTATPAEAFALLRALCKRKGIELMGADFSALEKLMPSRLTPGAAEALTVKIYRLVRTAGKTPIDALIESLTGYQNPIPAEVMDFQIGLAVAEATDMTFVPEAFRR